MGGFVQSESADADHVESNNAAALIERRIQNLKSWLRENGCDCTKEQAYLDDMSILEENI